MTPKKYVLKNKRSKKNVKHYSKKNKFNKMRGSGDDDFTKLLVNISANNPTPTQAKEPPKRIPTIAMRDINGTIRYRALT